MARARIRRDGFELDVEFSVDPGETVALLGPNGSGKSTTLRAIAGLETLDDGLIRCGDIVFDEPATGRFVPASQRRCGVVFQQYLLFDHLDVAANIEFGPRAMGASRADARALAKPWIERFELRDVATSHPRQLSGGQAQRVALARALANNPDILLLDEPLAALDAGTRRRVRRELRHHLDGFDGVRVLVTHDPVDAYALADRVVVLGDGRVNQTGTIAEITAHPRSRYVADLVGTNLVRGRVADGWLSTDDGARLAVSTKVIGDAFALIRPQSLTLSPVGEHPATSARNRVVGTVDDLDRRDDRVRVRIVGDLDLVAEITSSALDHLGLRPGDSVAATLKATDITVYQA